MEYRTTWKIIVSFTCTSLISAEGVNKKLQPVFKDWCKHLMFIALYCWFIRLYQNIAGDAKQCEKRAIQVLWSLRQSCIKMFKITLLFLMALTQQNQFESIRCLRAFLPSLSAPCCHLIHCSAKIHSAAIKIFLVNMKCSSISLST